MTYAIGSDHGGYALKETLKKYLAGKGYELVDYGTDSTESCDYPVYAEALAEAVARGEHTLGILVCGTGIGMSMAANKVPGIRAAVAGSAFAAKYTRLHNDANILCIGERVTGSGVACELAEIFFTTPFEGGRHQHRVDMIMEIEHKHSR